MCLLDFLDFFFGNKDEDDEEDDNDCKKYKKRAKKDKIEYIKKDSLLSKCEMQFYKKLSDLYGQNYIIQSQVNLASIIDKVSSSKFQNELYRNIDFGIFDKSTLKSLLMIELNDSSHKSKSR
jgi:hypothetical protein